MKYRILGSAILVSLVLSTGASRADPLGPATCGPLTNAYGPIDYRTATPEQHHLVEGAHFTQIVESLKSGKTSVWPASDIGYTLRVFPNHHRALLAMMNLAIKEGTEKPQASLYTLECWLERGERFQPDDKMVKAYFAIYLARHNRAAEAAQKLEGVGDVSEEFDPNLFYNLGLAYFELKMYDKALENAHQAYALGYPLAGLREKLKRVGHWRDTPPEPAASAPAGGASAPTAADSAPAR